MINLDGMEMFVSSTAAHGVVGSDTRLRFTQREHRVVARYSGGRVERGWLAGRMREQSSYSGICSERVATRFMAAARSARSALDDGPRGSSNTSRGPHEQDSGS